MPVDSTSSHAANSASPANPSRRGFLRAAGAVALGGIVAPTPLASCSGKSGGSGKEISFWNFYGPSPKANPQSRWFVNLVGEWNKNDDVKVKLRYIPNADYISGNVLQTAFSSGAGPDIFLISPGARNATAHLLDEGWTRPACVTGPARADTAQQRLAGYLDALQHRRVRAAHIRHTDHRADTARVAVAELLDQRNPPDSFFVANSSMALGALEELSHRGLRAGADIGLIAFDDAPWAAFVDPPMSVVAQPAHRLGSTAGELLLDRIAKKAPPQPRSVSPGRSAG